MSNTTEIRRLTRADLPALYRIRQVAFLDNISPTSAPAQAWHEKTLPYKYGRFVDGVLAACVSWYPDTMFLNGRPQTVGGLASVVSAAETRRRGHVRALMAHGLEHLRNEGIGWCLEYPFDTRYYRQFGWETVANGAFFEVPIDRFAEFKAAGDFCRLDYCPKTIAKLDEIYRAWAAHYNFTISRDKKIRDDWQNVLEGVPWRPGLPRFIFASDTAYCVVSIHEKGANTKVFVHDFAFKSGRGRAELLGFFNHFAGQADIVRLQLPGDDPLSYEWANFTIAHPNPLQARIVDVESALSGWVTHSPIDLTLEIRDDFCAWNHGKYRIFASANEPLSAQKGESTTADLVLDIRALTQILSGTILPAAAAHAGLLEGESAAIEQLSALRRSISFMSMADYF